MRFDKLKKQLELLILLSDSSSYTVNELCEKMDLSRRNFYYLLDFLKQAGFIIFKNEGCYHIDRRSPFFIDLLQAVQFSEAEVKTIYSLLQMIGKDSDTANQLRKKLENAYDFSVVANSPIRKQMESNLKVLKRAMERKKMVRLIGYSSPNSRSVRDRIVEPFLLLMIIRMFAAMSYSLIRIKLSRSHVWKILKSWILHGYMKINTGRYSLISLCSVERNDIM